MNLHSNQKLINIQRRYTLTI